MIAQQQTLKASKKPKQWLKSILYGLLFLVAAALLFIFAILLFMSNMLGTGYIGDAQISAGTFLFIFLNILSWIMLVGTLPCLILGIVHLVRGLTLLCGRALIGYPLAVSSLVLFLSLVNPSLSMHMQFLLSLLIHNLDFIQYSFWTIPFILFAFPIGMTLVIQDWIEARRAALLPTHRIK